MLTGVGPAIDIDRQVLSANSAPWAPAAAEVCAPSDNGRSTFEAAPVVPSKLRTSNYVAGVHVDVRYGGESHLGTLLGHDQFGRAVVQLDDGDVVRKQFRSVKPAPDAEGPETLRKAPTAALARIAPENIHDASPELRKAMDAALDKVVVGGHTIREYVQALQHEGFVTYVSGGATRDVFRALHENPNASIDTLLEALHDIDLVTNARPEDIRRIAAQVAPEAKDAGIWTDKGVNRWGVVGVGPRKEGLDICCIKAGSEFRWGSVLGRSLMDDAMARDFAMNGVYYDLATHRIADPTGRGISDAQNKILTPMHAPDETPMDAFRYLKFRARGYTAPEETVARYRRVIGEQWAESRANGGKDIVNAFLRLLPQEAREGSLFQIYAGVKRMLDALAGPAEEDGFAEAYRANVASLTSKMVTELLRRYGADRARALAQRQ